MIIDLSVPINAQTPVYPGDPPTKIEEAGRFEKDGFRDHYISIGTHVGTHIDAPMHMLEDGQSLDEIEIEQLVGPGKLFTAVGHNFDEINLSGIQSGDIVLFDTGMSQKYHEAVYFKDYPVMSEEVAKNLVKAGVKMVGLDTCSVDSLESFPIHKILLSGGVLIIENLANLDQLIGKEFTVYALPIKLQLDGAPARVIAEINN